MEFYYSKIALCKFLIPAFILIYIFHNYGINYEDIPQTLFVWTMLLFSVFMIVFQLLKVFNNQPQLIINSMGIDDCSLKIGVIYWQDIEKKYIKSFKPSSNILMQSDDDYICIQLSNPEKYLSRVSKYKKRLLSSNKARELGDISISLALLYPTADKAWEYIKQICESKHYIRNNTHADEYIKQNINLE